MKKIWMVFILFMLLVSCGDSGSGATSDLDSIAPGGTTDADTLIIVDEDAKKGVTGKLEFEFEGEINTGEDYENHKKGTGSYKITLGEDDYLIDNSLYSIIQTYKGEDEEIEERKFLQFRGYKIFEQSNNFYRFYGISVSVSMEKLKEIKKIGESNIDLTGDNNIFVSFWEDVINIRKDNVVMALSCVNAIADYSSKESLITIDHSENETFEAGENISANGNLDVLYNYDMELIKELFTDEAYDEYEGKWCKFFKDQANISKDEYLKELENNFGFEDKLPENFDKNDHENHAIFKFSGEVIKRGEKEKPGISDYNVMLEKEKLEVDDQKASASVLEIDGVDHIYVETIGDVSHLGIKHYAFNISVAYFKIDSLKNLKEKGGNTLDISNGNFFFSISKIESKEIENRGYIKNCVKAVIDKSFEKHFVSVFYDVDSEFAAGEIFEVAGNVTLSTDQEKIKEVYGESADNCYCSSEEGSISCEEFDAFLAGVNL